MLDLLLDDNNELRFEKGDYVLGESTAQHQKLLLMCPPGSFKENPDAGVGLMNYLESENPAELLRMIREQFNADGMEVKAIQIVNGQLSIDAPYK